MDLPDSMEDIIDLLEARAAQAPDILLLAWEPLEGAPREWSRAHFLRDVRAAAGALGGKGVQPGDRVLLHGDNSPELLLAWFACAWLGAVSVLLNPKLTGTELDWCAHHTGAVGIVAQRGLAGSAQISDGGLGWHLAMDKLETLHDTSPATVLAAAAGTTSATAPGARSAMPPDSAPPPRARISARKPGCMMFTSGTSARPKAVVWTRANALWAAQAGRCATGLREDDIAMVFLPLYHVVGLAWSVLPAIDAGASIVLQPRFSASRFWPVALARKATFASHVQFSSAALSRQPVPRKHHFRLWCNSTWLPEYEAHFRVPMLGWWGMTELVAPGIMGRPGEAQQPGAIGRAAPGYQLRIAGSAHDTLRPGDAGELEVQAERGRTIFSGYLDNDEANADAFTADGWFRTGDRMKVHADGSIQFLERARDVIKTGGEGVSPAEVERVIGAVEGVVQVSVVGRPERVVGEVGVAFVVAQPGTNAALLDNAIREACRMQLAAFKIPRELRFVDALPLAGINKVAKGELRRLAALSVEQPDPSSRG